MGVTDLLEHILRQQSRRRRRPLRRARRAQLPRLAREGEQVLLSAFGTPDPGEAVLEQATVEIAPYLLDDKPPLEPAPALEALLPLTALATTTRTKPTISSVMADPIPRLSGNHCN